VIWKVVSTLNKYTSLSSCDTAYFAIRKVVTYFVPPIWCNQ
jgi:hypothetical protein